MAKYEYVPLQFHPRAFTAFGRDLVTNDTVAVAELVKNCYDAFAYNVTVKITSAEIEICDDGLGMTEDIIRNSWAVVATPNKEKNPTIERDGKIRRVSGNKGLGRFSAARLGRHINIITRSTGQNTIEAEIDWEKLFNTESISDCEMMLDIDDEDIRSDIKDSGTIIIITGLYDDWNDKKILELQNALARLISPFESVNDFHIRLIYEGLEEPVEIKPQSFIENPTYSIKGDVDEDGKVVWKYQYSPKNTIITKKEGFIPWVDARLGFRGEHNFGNEDDETYNAGNFSFEIRAWDLDSESVADVSDTFNIGRRDIRRNISQYKGLSVYRDGILVLPKSEASRDWLGLDLRRISALAKRLSTSQIVGMINISSKCNPQIIDTTDREKLVDTIEYNQFRRIIETIITTFGNLRFLDKTSPENKPRSMSDLINPLSADQLLMNVEEHSRSGGSIEDVVDEVRQYVAENERVLSELNERLTYYAQTASLGSVAIVILHEILTGMGVIKRLITRIRKMKYSLDEKTLEYLTDTENTHARLIEVANSFAPLYKKNLRQDNNRCLLSKEIENSIRLVSAKKAAKGIEFRVEISEDGYVSVFEGELQTILINLLDNAVFWIEYSKKKEKAILICEKKIDSEHYIVTVSDTGVGIHQEEAEKIFQPGVTSKPHGIGMGLVIVTELLKYYNCKIATILPGEIGGATFEFNLPIAKG